MKQNYDHTNSTDDQPILAYLIERADKIGEELTWQIVRPIAYSPFEIRRGFAERLNYLCDIAE